MESLHDDVFNVLQLCSVDPAAEERSGPPGHFPLVKELLTPLLNSIMFGDREVFWTMLFSVNWCRIIP